MKSISLLLIVLFSSTYISTQNSIDLVTIAGQYSFPQDYETNFSKKATEYIWNANLKFPIVMSKSNIWYNEISYFNFQVKNENQMAVNRANPIDLHSFIMQTGLVHRLDENRALFLLFVPRFMSDFKNIDGKSFQFGGIAMYEKRFHSELTMRFGASFNQELFGPYVVPLVYLNWNLSDKWSIVGMLPVHAKVNYKMSNDLIIGFHQFGLITTYRLGNENYSKDYIERQSIDLSLFGRYRIAGNIHLETRVGFSLSRDYAQYSEDDKVSFGLPLAYFGDDRAQQNVSFNDGGFVNFRFVYNLPRDD